MSGASFTTPRVVRAGEAALWTAAALFVFTAHVGSAAWLMRERPAEQVDMEPPAAIMIEFAPEPEAVSTELDQITPDEQTAEESQPIEELDVPDDVLEEITEAEPEPIEEIVETETENAEPESVEEVVEEETEPVEEQLAELENVEVPLPVFKPKPPEKKPEIVKKAEPKKEPKKEEPEKRPVKRPPPREASKEAVEAKARAQQSKRNASRESSTGGLFSSSVTPAKWKSKLMAHLERRKKYPSGARKRGERGVVHIRFRIDDAGNVLSVSLARSSGFPELDNEVLSLVRRASPVPSPPPGVSKTVTAPVRFDKK